MRFFLHAALQRLGFGNSDLRHICAIGYAASQAALAVARSFTRVFLCNVLTMLKKFSVLGFPRGASIRCGLLLGLLISAAREGTISRTGLSGYYYANIRTNAGG